MDNVARSSFNPCSSFLYLSKWYELLLKFYLIGTSYLTILENIVCKCSVILFHISGDFSKKEKLVLLLTIWIFLAAILLLSTLLNVEFNRKFSIQILNIYVSRCKSAEKIISCMKSISGDFHFCTGAGNFRWTNDSVCSPSILMISTNFKAAIEECDQDPTCFYFYDKCGKGKTFKHCLKGSNLKSSNCGSDLYTKGKKYTTPSVYVSILSCLRINTMN